jgi:hypothetical protein
VVPSLERLKRAGGVASGMQLSQSSVGWRWTSVLRWPIRVMTRPGKPRKAVEGFHAHAVRSRTSFVESRVN